MSDTVDTQIAAILREVGELPADFHIVPTQSLKADLEIDSLKMIDVIVRVEAALNVEMGDDFSAELTTVADLQRYVSERVAA